MNSRFTTGIKNENGATMTPSEIISILTVSFGKPFISAITLNIKGGALCESVVSASEKGATAAKKMLSKAMEGTPMTELPEPGAKVCVVIFS